MVYRLCYYIRQQGYLENSCIFVAYVTVWVRQNLWHVKS